MRATEVGDGDTACWGWRGDIRWTKHQAGESGFELISVGGGLASAAEAPEPGEVGAQVVGPALKCDSVWSGSFNTELDRLETL